MSRHVDVLSPEIRDTFAGEYGSLRRDASAMAVLGQVPTLEHEDAIGQPRHGHAVDDDHRQPTGVGDPLALDRAPHSGELLFVWEQQLATVRAHSQSLRRKTIHRTIPEPSMRARLSG